MLSGGFTLLFGTSITTQVPKEGVGLDLIFFEIWICGGGKERWHFFWDQRNEVKSQKKWSPIQVPKEVRKGLLLGSRFVANQWLTLLVLGSHHKSRFQKKWGQIQVPNQVMKGLLLRLVFVVEGGRAHMHKLRSQKVKKGPLLGLEFVMEGGRPKRGGSGGVESLGGYLVMAYITGERAFWEPFVMRIEMTTFIHEESHKTKAPWNNKVKNWVLKKIV